MKQAKLISGKIQIKFLFPRGDDRFTETLQQVKSLDGRSFDPIKKCWWAVISKENINSLKKWRFNISEILIRAGKYDSFDALKIPQLPTIKGLKKKLYPFQHKGVEFVEAVNGRALIADEMGLGKTAQATAWLHLHPEVRPAIVICPASMKYIWQSEIYSWTEGRVQMVTGRNGYITKPIHSEIIIVNYDIVGNRLEELLAIKPKAIILDEVQYIKSHTTIRTKAIIKLCEGVEHIIGLSGTPITSKPIEFFNILKILNPVIFPNRWSYAKRYCSAKQGRFGWDLTGACRTSELHEILTNSVMIRRKKCNVLKDLPAKTRTVVPLDIDNRKEYEEVSKDVIKWIYKNEGMKAAEKASGAEVLVQMEKMKQVAVKGKMKQIISWIEDFLESGEKLVVFATHRLTLDLLQDKFGSLCIRIDGGTSPKAREEAVMEFQHGKTPLFIGNVKAAGIGITLTAASNTCFTELGWTPSEHIQAEDRVHRIGQKDGVEAWYLVAKDTIEEKIMKMLEKKSRVLDAILDGKSIKQESIFNDLLQSL